MAGLRIAVIGAGWAGLAAAVRATEAGHRVTVFEAARQAGGRARRVMVNGPHDTPLALDNGQHILIGAYTATLALMRTVGVDPTTALRRLPLSLKHPDGTGLALPDWPAPFNAAAGILRARGWSLADKASLLRAALRWRMQGFACDAHLTVAALCAGLRPRVMAELIEPLCVSALNTPVHEASAAVFLRVIQDALFGPRQQGVAASDLLLPRTDLGALLPDAALAWLASRGADVRLGTRVDALPCDEFDHTVIATPPNEAARLARAQGHADWAERAEALQHTAIATVYATGGPRLPQPMLALRSGPGAPAQFVFDRGQLGGPSGLLAFVVSAAEGDREEVQAQVVAQAAALGWTVQPLQTIVEKRATFACTPQGQVLRPPLPIAPGLLACGDHVQGPYPATLEGAVLSAEAVVQAINA